MKIAAGIAGILLGIFSLTYVGIFGTMVGAAAGFLGSIPFQGNNLGGWAEMAKMLSWLAPLATIVGGIVTFANPLVGGIILGVSAFLHWHLLGLGLIGKLFVLPIGATAALALFANASTRTATKFGAAKMPDEPARPGNAAAAEFDRVKWNALLQYDEDIASVAARLRPLGERWLDDFASSYLALNDKQYLPAIEQKIVSAAKAEIDKNARTQQDAAIRLEKQRQTHREEQRRLAEARRIRYALWRDWTWGTTGRKVVTVLSGVVVVVIATTVAYAYYHAQLQAEADKTIQTVMNRDPANWDWSEVDKALSHGGSPVTVGVDGRRWPLIVLAASTGNFDAVAMLIRYHADVNARDSEGQTPLQLAVVSASNQFNDATLARDSVRIGRLLLENGADVNALTTKLIRPGLTPLDIALEYPSRKINQDIVETLTKYGGRKTELKDRPAIDPEHDPRCHWEGLKRVCPDNLLPQR